jgi:hypothetical protein
MPEYKITEGDMIEKVKTLISLVGDCPSCRLQLYETLGLVETVLRTPGFEVTLRMQRDGKHFTTY